MNGRMTMQRTEKIPWKSEGARHAQVDCQVPVPRVIPAAIKAPTLQSIILISRKGDFQHSLVKVIQHPNTPRTPLTRESFAQVNTSRNARQRSSKTQHNSRDNKHGNILRRSLEQHTY
jgi:hypothetical protein